MYTYIYIYISNYTYTYIHIHINFGCQRMDCWYTYTERMWDSVMMIQPCPYPYRCAWPYGH